MVGSQVCLFGMTSFFRAGNTTDPRYENLRDGRKEPDKDGRGYLERIWNECAPYVDSDSAVKAPRDLASVFWELHLAHCLAFVGKNLAPRNPPRVQEQQRARSLCGRSGRVVGSCSRPSGNGTGRNFDEELEFGKVFKDYNPDPLVL